MRRPSAGPDPLLLLILASTGLGGAEACGGQSVSDAVDASGGVGGTTGGVGGSTGGTGGSVSGSGGSLPLVTEGRVACNNPTYPWGVEAGYVFCDQGFYHRSEAGTCPQTPVGEGEATGTSPCVTDADCASLENGRCYRGGGFYVAARCVSSCETDADCGPAAACFCGEVANVCVPTTCHSDADCGDDLLCTSFTVPDGPCSATFGFACQTPEDECTLACPAGHQCRLAGERSGTRECVGQAGVGGSCGRPFLVSGSERLARATTRDDWCGDELSPELDGLTATERLALASHWQAAALMEHASIAAFARFALELLSLGAPAALVEQASNAMGDEQRHATTCFALASAFAGARLGPDALSVAGCLSAVDLDSITLTTFLEGCIGETIAAIEARELALTAEDPVVRQTLAAIAEDEAQHALLAWRFLEWALAKGGLGLAGRVHDVWAQEVERCVTPPSGVVLAPERELELGLPPAGFRAEVRRHVLEEIVGPCLRALGRSRTDRAA